MSIEKAVDDFWTLSRGGTPVPEEWAGKLSVEEGMRVQLGIADRWENAGIRRAGWKVGATNAAVQKQLGIDEPAFGSLLENAVLWSGCALDLENSTGPHVESELCFRIADDLVDVTTVEDLRRRISFVYPAFELIEKRVSIREDVGGAMADNAETWRIVLGDPVPVQRDVDFSAVTCTLTVEGEEVAVGLGDRIMGDPLNSILWLVQRLRRFGRTILAGELVMTGSFVPQTPLSGAQHVRADFSGIGRVDLTTTS